MAVAHVKTNDVCHFSKLLPEIKIRVFGFLPSQALHTSCHVCSAWNRLINDENFPLIEWNKNKCEAGNENLRKDFENAAAGLGSPLGDKIDEILMKTPNPFSDRKRIVDYVLNNKQDWALSSVAWRSVSQHRCLPLCEVFLPLVKDTCYFEQGIALAIQQGHVALVKRLLPELDKKRANEKICITVQYPTKEGESLSLRGFIGDGSYDLNSWEKGFPMKKVRGTTDLWEIILIPVVHGETTNEYNPEKDNILFPFKPVLHSADGKFLMSQDKYFVKPRTDVTIMPKFLEEQVESSVSQNDSMHDSSELLESSLSQDDSLYDSDTLF